MELVWLTSFFFLLAHLVEKQYRIAFHGFFVLLLSKPENMEPLKLDLNKRYTYADYYTWWDDVRRELHDGRIVELETPYRKHQQVSVHFVGILGNYNEGKNIHAFHAPLDVRLPKNDEQTRDDEIYTVVQPDLMIICDESKLDERGCVGPPDFVIEIVDKRSGKRDIRDKFEIYQKHGVREYWIVNPNDENVTVFVLDENGKFQFRGMYGDDDKIPVGIFEGDLKIDLMEVFG